MGKESHGEFYTAPAPQPKSEYVTPVGLGTPEKGRNEISMEAANAIQIELARRMGKVHKEIAELMTTNDNDPMVAELMMRFMDMYYIDFNGFTEFCNLKSQDRAFIERAQKLELLDEDYNEMAHFLEKSEHGQPLFKNNAEVKEFVNSFKKKSMH